MYKMKKRLGAAVLTLCMLITLLPLPAAAAGVIWQVNNGVLTVIGNGEFDPSDNPSWQTNQKNFTSAVLNEGVTGIAIGAFAECDRLESVSLPGTLTEIGEMAFAGCSSLTSVTIPSGVTLIPVNCFEECTSLASVTLPEGLTEIEGNAFGGCVSLSQINLPASLERIGRQAFLNCGALNTPVTIPAGVTEIGGSDGAAFMGSGSIPAFSANSAYFASEDGVLYDSGETELVAYPAGKSADSYTLPATVTAIQDGALSNAGSLTRIDVEEGNPAFSSLDGVLYNKDQTVLLVCPAGKTGRVVLPETITGMGYAAFAGCTGIDRIVASEEVYERLKNSYNSYETPAFLPDYDIIQDEYVYPRSVTILENGVNVTGSEITMEVGDTLVLGSRVMPADTTFPDVLWYSATDAVVQVEDHGDGTATLTALKEGQASVMVRAAWHNQDGEEVSASCTIHVNRVPVTKIILDQPGLEDALKFYPGDTASITATIYPGNATNKEIQWTFNPELVRVIAQDGSTNNGNRELTTTAVTGGGGAYATSTVTIKALASGTGVIRAAALGGEGILTECPLNIPYGVESVTINKNTTAFTNGRVLLSALGEKQTISATIDPEAAETKTLTWVSSDEDVVTVAPENPGSTATTQSATVTAVGSGTAKITVKSTQNTEAADECTVEVVVKVRGVSLDETFLSLAEEETAALTATIDPSAADDKGLTWTSSAESIATVTPRSATADRAGQHTATVTALTPGTAVITVTTADGGKSATCTVEVTTTHVTGISLDKSAIDDMSLTDPAKKTASLTATLEPEKATNKTIKWASSDEGVVSVSAASTTAALNGQNKLTSQITLTARGVGTATVTATSEDGARQAVCLVTVPRIEVTDVALNPADHSVILELGAATGASASYSLTATVTPPDATDTGLSWSSSNPNVVRVEPSGATDARGVAHAVITAVNPGSATVSVTSADGKHTDMCAVTVRRAITSFTLNKTETTITTGETEALSAIVLPADAGQGASWVSDDTSVATVEADTGLVTAVAPGEATVTATSTADTTRSASCKVTVKDPFVSVTGVTLSPDTLTMSLTVAAKKTANLTAAVAPTNATNKTVSYLSTNETVATVDETGKVTAVGEGKAAIIATTEDGGFTASCAVDVPVTVKGVSLNKTALELGIGQSERLVPALDPVDPANKNLTWSVAMQGVSAATAATYVSVDDQGLVTAHKIHPTLSETRVTVTVTTEDGGKTASCVVTVLPTKVTRVTLNKQQAELAIGDTLDLTAAVEPDNASNRAVTWQSLDGSVATVALKTAGNDKVATVTALKPGRAEIRVTTADQNYQASCIVTVKPNDVTGVTLTPPSYDELSLTDAAKKNVTLTAALSPADATDKKVTWQVADESVVSLSAVSGEAGADGRVSVIATALKAGTTTVFVTTEDGGFTAQSVLTVPETPITSFALSKSEMKLVLGGGGSGSADAPLTVTALPLDPTWKKITWESSDPSVAEVSLAETALPAATGLSTVNVIGKSAGSAIITARSEDGVHSAVCAVTVYAAPTAVRLNTYQTTVITGTTEALSAAVEPASAEQTVNWTTSDPAVATVEGGVVTAVGPGSARITATVPVYGFSASCAVTVEDPFVHVDGLTLAPRTASALTGLKKNDTARLVLTLTPSDATNRKVTLRSSNEAVAKLLVDGAERTGAVEVTPAVSGGTASAEISVKIVGEGPARITAVAEDGGKTAEQDIQVDVAVTGVELSKSALTLGLQQTDVLTATVLPLSATNPNVTWRSSNASVVAVSGSGRSVTLTPKAVGTATITVTTADGGRTASCAVTVQKTDVERVKLNKAAMTLDLVNTKTGTLTATIEPSDATVQTMTWESDNPAVAAVTGSGSTATVTAAAPGQAVITVKTTDASRTASCTVTVNPTRVSALTMDSVTELALGQSRALNVTVTPSNATNKALTWFSSDPAVISLNKTATADADVNAAGKVAVTIKAEKVGKATVSATSADGGITVSRTIVVPETKITAIALDKTSVRLEKSGTGSAGETATLTATLTPAAPTYNTVTWASSDPNVVTVSAASQTAGADGKATVTVTAKNPGTASVTATSADSSISATALIRVYSAPTAVTIRRDGAALTPAVPTELTVDEKAALSAAVTPASAEQTVTWTSSAPAIAAVDAQGVVTARAPGQATITATVTAGGAATAVKTTCAVKVTAKHIGVTKIALAPKTVTLRLTPWNGIPSSAAVTATVTPATATDRDKITWLSSDPAIVEVTPGQNGTATLTAKGEGSASVAATTQDGGFTDTVTVTVEKAVTGVEISRSAFTMGIESPAEPLSAAVLPDGAAETGLTWKAETLDASGNVADGAAPVVQLSAAAGRNVTVTPKAVGKAKITVTTTDGGFSKTCTVTVTATAVSKVTLDESRLDLDMGSGKTGTLKATVTPASAANQTLSWSVSPTGIVTVAEKAGSSGKEATVTAVKPGTATVTVTSEDGSYSASCTVVVAETKVQGVSLSATALTMDLTANREKNLTATLSPADPTDKTMTWASSDSSVVSLSATSSTAGAGGQATVKLTALKAGTATITVTTADGGKTARCVVNIPEVTVQSLTLNKSAITLEISSTVGRETLTATLTPATATDASVTWRSSNSAVASVTPASGNDKSATVTAVAVGTATITAASADGKHVAACAVTVRSVASSVSLNKYTLSLTAGDASTPGQSEALIATVDPATADQNITWESSNPAIASVNDRGVVTANAAGTARITAKATEAPAKRAVCDVTVTDIRVNVTGVGLAVKSGSTARKGQSAVLEATISPAAATDQTLTWRTTNPAVATLSETQTTAAGGKATAKVSIVGEGTASVIVTTADGGKSAEYAINVPVSVTGVAVNKSAVTLGVDQSETLMAVLSPGGAANSAVTWTLNPANTDVLEIVSTDSATVTVQAKKPGTARVVVTADDTTNGTKRGECAVTVQETAVQRVTLDKPSLDLDLTAAKTGTLRATLDPAGATNPQINWTASPAGIVTLSAATGAQITVTAVKPGSAVVTAASAESGTIKATCTVTVAETRVQSIALSASQQQLATDGTFTLTATLSPKAPTDKTILWQSSDPAVADVSAPTTATLDANGRASVTVTAKKAGSAVITATTRDGAKSAGCAVTIPVTPVGSLSVAPEAVTLTLGGSDNKKTLEATLAPVTATDLGVSWESDKPNVVSVNPGSDRASASTGKATAEITAVAAGTASITVRSADGRAVAVCQVTVRSAVTGVGLNKTALVLTAGQSEALSVTVTPSTADQGVTWSTGDAGIATVTDGVVTAVGEGQTTITATSGADGTKKAVCAVTVEAPVTHVSGVSLNKSAATILKGAAEQLTATVLPADATDRSVTWKSSDETVATVDQTGKVTAKNKGGTASIIVTTTDGSRTAVCTVTVPVPVTGVRLSESAVAMGLAAENKTHVLTAIVEPSNAANTAVTWSTSSAAIATVTDGVITARAAGTATITATTADGGKTASCTVTVRATDAAHVELNASAITLDAGGTYQLSATVLPTDAADRTVTWQSSAAGVATVDAAGKVTAVAPNADGTDGVATITATTRTGGYKAACVVTVRAKHATGVTLNTLSHTFTGTASTLTLTAAVQPASATDKTVTWMSTNTAVAAVSAAGVVTPKAPGTASIVVTTKDGGFTAACEITVKPTAVSSITLSPAEKTLKTGGNVTLTATVLPNNATDKTLTWFTTDPAVATVANGAVTAVGPGVAGITAVSADGQVSGAATITVQAVATGISLNKTALTLTAGSFETLSAAVEPAAADQGLRWSSSSTAVATVDQTGKVTAVAAGTATITVRTTDTGTGFTKTCAVTVQAVRVDVDDITLSALAETLNKGATASLTATLDPAAPTNKTIRWTTSDANVIALNKTTDTANAQGKSTVTLTAKGPGTATITAIADNGKSAQVSVKVPLGVTAVTLNKDTVSLGVGGTDVLSVTVTPLAAENPEVEWSSSDTAGNYVTCAVSADKRSVTLTGVRTTASPVTITARSKEDGSIQAQCAVTVKETDVSVTASGSLTLTPANPSVTLRVSPADAPVSLGVTGSTQYVTSTAGSGVYTYTLNDNAAGNCAFTLTFSLTGSGYRFVGTGTFAINAVARPIRSVAVTPKEGEHLTAAVDDTTIRVAGSVKDLSALRFTTGAGDYRLTVETTGLSDAVCTVSGDTLTVRSGGSVVAAYTLDTSGVAELANMEIAAEPPQVHSDVAGVTLTSPAVAGIDTAATQALKQIVEDARSNAGIDLGQGDDAHVEVWLEIDATAYEGDAENATLTLDVTPKYAITKEGEASPAASGDLSSLASPIAITVDVSVEPRAIKHIKSDGSTEYLTFTSAKKGENLWTVTWWQSSFSPVQLLSTVMEGQLALQSGATTVTRTYTEAEIGTPLPGKFTDGSGKTYSALTEALMREIDQARKAGRTLTLRAVVNKVEAAVSGTTLTCTVAADRDLQNAVLMAVSYDAAGKMLGAKTQRVNVREGVEQTVTFTGLTRGAAYRVFFLENGTFRPVSDKWEGR